MEFSLSCGAHWNRGTCWLKSQSRDALCAAWIPRWSASRWLSEGYIDPARYAVTCNGRRVPLQPTVAPGALVAGIRYRARMLNSSLYPTIPIHAPLTFEVIDTLNSRSLVKCMYHASAPQGRIYSGIPADSAAAEARRAERFVRMDPAEGPAVVPEPEINPGFPGTLDLRIPGRGLKL